MLKLETAFWILEHMRLPVETLHNVKLRRPGASRAATQAPDRSGM
jgi:hypothetical protein